MTKAPFGGVIGRTIADSVPSWESARRPAADAPNIVMIVLDDVGFAQLGSYGGSIKTPAMDSLAEQGIRYTNFHVTPLCSPTRASLLTGRNNHSVGMGFLAGTDSGFPAYRGQITNRAATLARMLHEDGYGTYALGKWHLTPAKHLGPAGPFDDWPLGQGFDRYYGFMWGEDDQWSPQLWEDNHFIETPTDPGYHFSTDLAAQSKRYMSDHLSASGGRPFFLYLAFGAGHAPHQAPVDYLQQQRGKWDHGWDVERERVHQRQLDLGVIPAGTELPPGNPEVQPWAELSDDQRRLYTRLQEAFAAMVEHTDDAIKEVLDFLTKQGLDDNTMVILMSDNGASGEGGPNGFVNEYRYFLGIEESLEDALSQIDEIGGPATHNIYPSGWAQAGNTPLRFYKKHTYGGGVRAPLMVRWPARGLEPGGIRPQFHFVTDILPTVLEATNVTAKEQYDGVDQMPIHGTAMTYSFDSASVPSTKDRQHFEMIGSRGMWSKGWKAVTNHAEGDDYDSEPWALYRLDEDFSETQDLAKQHPDKVNELKSMWWEDAERYGVLPLDDRWKSRYVKKGTEAGPTHFSLLPGTRLFSTAVGPNWYGRPFRVSARITRSESDEGVIIAFGRRPAGFSFFVQDGRLVLDYNRVGEHFIVESGPGSVPTGDSHVVLHVDQSPDSEWAPVKLLVNGALVGSGEVRVLHAGLGNMSTQVGHNAPSQVSMRYKPPFSFTGTIHSIDVDFETPPAQQLAAQEAIPGRLRDRKRTGSSPTRYTGIHQASTNKEKQ